MYFIEKNILKYIKHLQESFWKELHTNYRTTVHGVPGSLENLSCLRSNSYLLIYTQESCFNYTERVQSTLLHTSKSYGKRKGDAQERTPAV